MSDQAMSVSRETELLECDPVTVASKPPLPTALRGGGNGKGGPLAAAARARAITALTGGIAVVMGGTSGLGRAIALGLAESGASVVPSGRRSECVREVCEGITRMGRSSMPQTVDVRDRASID